MNQSVAENREIDVDMVRSASEEVLNRPLEIGPEFVANALDPWAFVQNRAITVGCDPEATSAAISICNERLARDESFLDDLNASIERAHPVGDGLVSEITDLGRRQ